MAEQIRVVVADDHPTQRVGIRIILTDEPDIVVVGEAGDGDATQRLCHELRPDVLVLDLRMPGPPARDTVAFLHEHCPDIHVLVLSAYDDDVYVHDMLALGVVGYLLKDEMPETVVKAVRTVMQGGAWFSPPIKEKMRQVGSGKADQAKEPNLSDQDRDILKLMAAGLDNARIATQVNLAEKTVRNYLSRIYRELGVHSDREAIAWLKEHSWA